MTRSTLAGSLKVYGQIAVALVVYPLVIREGGSEALGAWVLLQVTVGYGGLVHVGMGTLLSKRTAESETTSEGGLGQALTCSLLLAAALSLAVWVGTSSIESAFVDDEAVTLPAAAVWMVLGGVLLRLFASLYEAALTGLQQAYLVQLVQFAQTVVFVALVIVLPETAILLTLSMAFLMSYGLELLLSVVLLSCHAPALVRTLPTLRVDRLIGFLADMRPYALVEVSLLAREPLLKYVLFLCCGASVVGGYELATKVPSTIRQAFVLGLSALLPAVAKLRTGASESIGRLGRGALHYLMFTALGALLLYALNAELILGVWLGVVPEGVLSLTRILTGWWAIATLNVPAWWLGMALGTVNTNAKIVAGHLLFTAGLVFLTPLPGMEALELVGLWVGAGVIMQVVLYWSLQEQTKLIAPIYLSPDTVKASLVLGTVGAVTTAAALSARGFGALPLQTLVLSGGVYALLVLILARKYVSREGSANA